MLIKKQMVLVGCVLLWFDTRGPFYQYGLTAWIGHHTHYKVRDQITYPFPNLYGASVEVWG